MSMGKVLAVLLVAALVYVLGWGITGSALLALAYTAFVAALLGIGFLVISILVVLWYW